MCALHGVSFLAVLAYIILSIYRKSRFSLYKWVQLVQCLLLYTVHIAYNLTSFSNNHTTNEDCGLSQDMYYGVIYFLLYTSLLMIAWQTQSFFRQVAGFIADGHLPSEKTKKRVNAIMISIWAVMCLQWIFYCLINMIQSHKNNFKFLYYFNFL